MHAYCTISEPCTRDRQRFALAWLARPRELFQRVAGEEPAAAALSATFRGTSVVRPSRVCPPLFHSRVSTSNRGHTCAGLPGSYTGAERDPARLALETVRDKASRHSLDPTTRFPFLPFLISPSIRPILLSVSPFPPASLSKEWESLDGVKTPSLELPFPGSFPGRALLCTFPAREDTAMSSTELKPTCSAPEDVYTNADLDPTTDPSQRSWGYATCATRPEALSPLLPQSTY